MQQYLYFTYRPPVKPRPNPHGVFSDVIKFKTPQPIEPFFMTDSAVLVPFSGGSTDSTVITDSVTITLSAVENVTGSDLETLNSQTAPVTESAFVSDSAIVAGLSFTYVDSISFTENFQEVFDAIDSISFSDSFALAAMQVTENAFATDSEALTQPPKAALEVMYASDSTTGFSLSYVDTITESEVYSIAGKNIEGIYVTDNVTFTQSKTETMILADTAGLSKYTMSESLISDNLTNLLTH